jgi:hypothetical protein
MRCTINQAAKALGLRLKASLLDLQAQDALIDHLQVEDLE